MSHDVEEAIGTPGGICFRRTGRLPPEPHKGMSLHMVIPGGAFFINSGLRRC
jgi:hypothetical protein